MRRGPKATPKLLEALHGRPHRKKSDAEEPAGVGDLWAPPDWMTEAQRDQWHYAVEHSPPGLLSGTDREALASFCVHATEFIRASKQYASEPLTYKSDTGVVHANPLGPALQRHTHMMIRAIEQLGFSPASRAALGRSGPEFSNAPAAQIGQPRANPRLAAYLDSNPDKINGHD